MLKASEHDDDHDDDNEETDHDPEKPEGDGV